MVSKFAETADYGSSGKTDNADYGAVWIEQGLAAPHLRPRHSRGGQNGCPTLSRLKHENGPERHLKFAACRRWEYGTKQTLTCRIIGAAVAAVIQTTPMFLRKIDNAMIPKFINPNLLHESNHKYRNRRQIYEV